MPFLRNVLYIYKTKRHKIVLYFNSLRMFYESNSRNMKYNYNTIL